MSARTGAALALVAAAVLALGIAWWRDGARPYETPEWKPARFVQLVPATMAERERWLVAVNLRCPHCQAHLRALATRIATRPRPWRISSITATLRVPHQPPDSNVRTEWSSSSRESIGPFRSS